MRDQSQTISLNANEVFIDFGHKNGTQIYSGQSTMIVDTNHPMYIPCYGNATETRNANIIYYLYVYLGVDNIIIASYYGTIPFANDIIPYVSIQYKNY